MTVPFPLSPAPAWYLQADWTTFDRKRNGVFYVGDEIDVQFVSGAGGGPKTCTFESGLNGATITTGDIGTRTAWTAIVGSPKYSNVHAYDTLAGRYFSSEVQKTEWTYSSAVTEEYGRAYLYATANPATEDIWLNQCQSHAISIRTDGKVKIFDSLAFGGHSATTTTPIGLNQWVRLEWHMVYGAGSTGSFELRLFNSPDSTTPTETISGTNWYMGTSNNLARIGNGTPLHAGTTWGSDIWLDNLVAAAEDWPGPAGTEPDDPETLTYTVRDYYGNVVSTGPTGRHVLPTEPDGGWQPGWYRLYLEGIEYDELFGYAAGVTNFCIIRDDDRFPTMPIPSTSGGANGEAPDLVMKGVMGIGTSRLIIDNAYAPTTGGSTLAVIESDAAISKQWWLDWEDPVRPRYLWTTFPNGSVDFIALPGSVADTYWLIVYPKTPAINGATTFVRLEAGSVSGAKITVRSPNSSTIVETYDNLASSAAAATALAASAYVVGFAGSAANPGTLAATAIGTAFKDGVGLCVSTLYPLGVTRFEGPCNEGTFRITPTVSRHVAMGPEIAHQMRLFQANVHAGHASAKAIGPGPVNIYVDQFEPFFAAGGGAYCDEISFHAYNAIANGDINLGRLILDEFLDMLDSYGYADVPLWQTESTGVFTAVYRVVHARRARVEVMERLLMEQVGIPVERNNPWYDRSHGFWGFPQFLENGDYSLQPQCVLERTLAEEIWGTTLAEVADLGDPGNRIYVASRYEAPDTSGVIVIQSVSHIPDATVTFTVTGTAGPVEYRTALGAEDTAPINSGRVTVPVDDVATFVRIPAGATLTFYSCNDWEPGSLTNLALGAAASVGGVDTDVPTDDLFLELFNGASNPVTFRSANEPPEDVLIDLGSEQQVGRVIVWCGGVWQTLSAFLDFTVETSLDDITYTEQAVVDVAAGATSFLFGSDSSNTGCQRETFWPEQCVFDVPFTPVTARYIRIAVGSTSYGGSPDGIYGFNGDQGDDEQHITLQEIGVYAAGAAPTPPENTVAPVASGSPYVGWQVSSTTGTWTGSPTSYGYQWQSSPDGTTDWQDIVGETTSAYTIDGSELTRFLRCVVTAFNDEGASSPVPSNVLGPVRTPPTPGGSSPGGSMLPGGTTVYLPRKRARKTGFKRRRM